LNIIILCFFVLKNIKSSILLKNLKEKLTSTTTSSPLPRASRARPAPRGCEAEDPGEALLGRQGPEGALEASAARARNRPVSAARRAPATRLPGQPGGRPALSK